MTTASAYFMQQSYARAYPAMMKRLCPLPFKGRAGVGMGLFPRHRCYDLKPTPFCNNHSATAPSAATNASITT
jgi:hypothetical protein